MCEQCNSSNRAGARDASSGKKYNRPHSEFKQIILGSVGLPLDQIQRENDAYYGGYYNTTRQKGK